MTKILPKYSDFPKSIGHAIKIGEAAKLLGVHIDTLRRWERSGKIRPVRTPGGTRLYPLDELKKLNLGSLVHISKSESLKNKVVKELDNEDESLKNLDFELTKQEIQTEPALLKREDNSENEGSEKQLVKTENGENKKIEVGLVSTPRSYIGNYLIIMGAVFILLVSIGLGNIQLYAANNSNPSKTKISTPIVLPKAEVLSETQEIVPGIVEATSGATVISWATIKTEDPNLLVNIRENPSTSSRKIGQAKNGERFEFISLESDWYQIKTANGSAGFISAEYVEGPH